LKKFLNHLSKANSLVKSDKIFSFEDPSLKNGFLLIKLCKAVDPNSCNVDFISQTDFESNAKYAINIARRMGILIYFSHEDIVELNSKLIMNFVSQILKKLE
jgi:plastin-1